MTIKAAKNPLTTDEPKMANTLKKSCPEVEVQYPTPSKRTSFDKVVYSLSEEAPTIVAVVDRNKRNRRVIFRLWFGLRLKKRQNPYERYALNKILQRI